MASVTIRGGGGGGGCGTGGLGGLLHCMYLQTKWNPINTVTNGPKKFGVSTGGHIKEGFFLQENAWQFLQGGQKKWP